MADVYFKKTLIFQRFKKGLRQYPFSFVEVVSPGDPGSPETILFSGMMPDGDIGYSPTTDGFFNDQHDTTVINHNFMIDPSFIYEGMNGIGNSW